MTGPQEPYDPAEDHDPYDELFGGPPLPPTVYPPPKAPKVRPWPPRTVGQIPWDGNDLIRAAAVILCMGGAEHDEPRELLRVGLEYHPEGPWLLAFLVPKPGGEPTGAAQPKEADDGHLYYDLPCPSCHRRFQRDVAGLARSLAEYQTDHAGESWVIDISDPSTSEEQGGRP